MNGTLATDGRKNAGHIVTGILEEKMTNEELNDVLADIKSQCWDSGMNMAGEYQGVWVRFRDIEKIIDGHIKEAAATEHKLETAVNGFFDSFAEMSRKFDETFYKKEGE